jgi:hypothetical protein
MAQPWEAGGHPGFNFLTILLFIQKDTLDLWRSLGRASSCPSGR